MSDDFLNYAFNYWLKKGYSPAGAAAMAGQAQWESRGNPAMVHDNGTGRGLYGWRLDRRDNLDKAPNNTTVPGQLDFADSELTGPYKDIGDKIRNAKDITEATNSVLGYLRPQNYTPQNPEGSIHYAQRYNLGAGLLNQPEMAQVLAMPPTRQVGTAPGMVPADVVAATTPPSDPRTAGDADLGGYGGSPKLPTATADKPFDFLGFASRGLATAAAGEGQAPQQLPWIQQAMNAQGQVHRPQAQGLLTDILEDPEDKKRRLMAGLLGA